MWESVRRRLRRKPDRGSAGATGTFRTLSCASLQSEPLPASRSRSRRGRRREERPYERTRVDEGPAQRTGTRVTVSPTHFAAWADTFAAPPAAVPDGEDGDGFFLVIGLGR